MKTPITTVAIVFFILFVTAAKGWAIASYAQKYGLECKSCHTTGSKLNDRGVTFKINKHTFVGKNAPQEENPKQGAISNKAYSAPDDAAPRDEQSLPNNKLNIWKSGDGTKHYSFGGKAAPQKENPKPGAVENMDDTAPVVTIRKDEQSIPTNKVYIWKSSDGTTHFSDTSIGNQQSEKKTGSGTKGKKLTNSNLRTQSVIIAKRSQNAARKPVTPITAKTVLPSPDSPGQTLTSQNIRPINMPKKFETCMEQILKSYPVPTTSAIAMGQFREAENQCAPYE